jgi:hypothetical protein
LRRSAWTLLIQLGERERLAALLASGEFPTDDLMLQDLRVAAVELGVIPVNHEEVIWLRRLRQPEMAEFWSAAVAAVSALPPARRADFELRDLSILIAASRHEPGLIERSRDDLYEEVESHLRSRSRFDPSSGYDSNSSMPPERLADHRDNLTWGDLAAMLMALRALDVPQVIDHLFDYAERDRLDESTEYGGVIHLDDRQRFEVLEFPPRVRYGDWKFEASQEMFDAGYAALFHFHFHCQRYNNARFAGPGAGDIAYAENARVNCLVLTYVREGTMNVDFYRHGRVIVDLGDIERGSR